MIDVKIIKKPKSGRAAIGGGIATAANSYTNDSQQTLADVLNFNAAVSRLLQPYDANNQPLAWAQATDPDGDGGIKAKTLRASVTFASVGDVVAYQNGNLSGGTGGGGLDITALEDYLTTNGYATQAWVSAHFNDYVLTKAAVEAVLTGNITSHTHNQYLTEHQSLANYMTRGEIGDTYQTKDAALSFTAASGYVAARFTDAALATAAAQNYIELWGTDGWFNLQAGHLLAHGAVTATSFVKTGGTATQFLKADGSVDSNSYLTEHQSLANYMTRGEIGDTYQAKSTALSFTAAEGYVAARFADNTLCAAAVDKYIEFWCNSGWYNFEIGSLTAHGAATATQFIRTGGTASQFLKADGSIDTNTYLTTGAASDTYLPKAAYTAADILTKLKTVDGSGSGLDADMLDGVHGKDYMYYPAYCFENGWWCP